DCIARRPDGSLLRHKLLSSGVARGVAAAESTLHIILYPPRQQDPDGFWQGSVLRLFGDRAEIIAESQVSQFDARTGSLHLSNPLKSESVALQPDELASDEQPPLTAIRYLLGLRRDEPIPPIVLRLGTTRGTNALIT